MITIFAEGKIWDQYEINGLVKPNIPIYALAYNSIGKTWWIWYHSWNNVTMDINTGRRELPDVAKAWLLLNTED